jgi:hypothetical protein
MTTTRAEKSALHHPARQSKSTTNHQPEVQLVHKKSDFDIPLGAVKSKIENPLHLVQKNTETGVAQPRRNNP